MQDWMLCRSRLKAPGPPARLDVSILAVDLALRNIFLVDFVRVSDLAHGSVCGVCSSKLGK